MANFVIYYHPKSYEPGELLRTINGLKDSVPADDIDKVFICRDGDLYDDAEIAEDDRIELVKADSIGRAKLNNLVIDRLDDNDAVIFLNGPTKFKPGWYDYLKSYIKDDLLVSSQVCGLDRMHWSFDKIRWNKFGFRWNLDLICKQDHVTTDACDTAVVSSYCIAGQVGRFKTIGGFDNGMELGNGEDIEISIRNWLMGGSCRVVMDSKIAVTPRMSHEGDIKNKARIAELWLGKRNKYYYDSIGVPASDIKVGRLNNFNNIEEKFERSFNWYIESHQPEIGKIYDLPKWHGKSIGIVSNGYSIDVIDSAVINKHDILIGVDFMGGTFECDYLVTNDVSVVEQMSHLYKQKEFFLPIRVTDVNNGRYVKYSDVMPQAVAFESTNNEVDRYFTAQPPFVDYNDNTMYAAQLAVFMQPREIVIYGLDNKIINGKSHTANIEYYSGGEVLTDNSVTRKHYANVEHGLSRLGSIAAKKGINLLRMSHL